MSKTMCFFTFLRNIRGLYRGSRSATVLGLITMVRSTSSAGAVNGNESATPRRIGFRTMSDHAAPTRNAGVVVKQLEAARKQGAVSREVHPYIASAALVAILERLSAHYRALHHFGASRDELIETCARILHQVISGSADD